MTQLAIAFDQAERGMALAEMGACNVDPDWPERALAFLRAYAETHDLFPMYFVVDAAEHDESMPDVNPRAWGPITQRGLNRKIIEKSGRTVPHPSRHGCPAYVFRSLVYRGAHEPF